MQAIFKKFTFIQADSLEEIQTFLGHDSDVTEYMPTPLCPYHFFAISKNFVNKSVKKNNFILLFDNGDIQESERKEFEKLVDTTVVLR